MKKVFLLTSSVLSLCLSHFATADSVSVECLPEKSEASNKLKISNVLPIVFEVPTEFTQVTGTAQRMDSSEKVNFTLPCTSSEENSSISCQGVMLEKHDNGGSVTLPGLFTKETGGSFNFHFLPMTWTLPPGLPGQFAALMQAAMQEASEAAVGLQFTCTLKETN